MLIDLNFGGHVMKEMYIKKQKTIENCWKAHANAISWVLRKATAMQ